MRYHLLLQQLLDASMVQLWVVGAERPADHPPLLRYVAADHEPPRLRGMLEEGARAQNRAQFPAIEMHSILVLDRWSLFDKATAHRTSLRRALDTACRTSCDEAGAPEFDYEWISLADTTRAATNPDDDTVEVARRLIQDDSFPDRVLLIDRKDAGNAVIERPLADTSFVQVATAILTSDAAFPTANTEQSAAFGGDSPLRAVIPISLVNLHHPDRRIKDSVGERLWDRLASASVPPATLRWNERIPKLDSLPDVEADEMARGIFSSRAARDRRRSSVTELLRVVLASRLRDTGAIDQIDRAQRAARRLFPPSAQPSSVSASAIVAPMAASTVEQASVTAVTGLIALGAVAATAISWWRKRPGHPSVDTARTPPSASALAEHRPEARLQWDQLCSRMDAIVSEWQRQFRPSGSPPGPPGRALVWERDSTTPYDWRLAADPVARDDLRALDEHEYQELARLCAQLLENETPTAELLRASLDRIAHEQLDRAPTLRSAVIQAAITTADTSAITRSLDPTRTPLMVYAAPSTVSEVLWMFDPTVIECEQLKRLEPASTRAIVRCMTQDDPSRSTRLAFGNPIQWRSVLSLAPLAL
jgi:hypothetical protein